MFEDKRYKNNNDNNSNLFVPDNSIGLQDGNDNLNFGEQPILRKKVKPKKEKSNNKIFLKLIIVLLVLCLIVGIGYLIIKIVFNNPYKVYQNAINYGYEYVDNKVNDFKNKRLDYDINKDILSTSGSLIIDSNLLEDFKGYEFKYKISSDFNKKMVDSSLIVDKDDKEIFNIEGNLRDNKLLVSAKDVYNKYLQIGTTQDLEFNNINFNDNILNDILKVIKDSLINNLDKNNMNTKKTKLMVQNKNVNVINNIYKLNKEDVKKIYQDIIEAIINDDNIINNIAETFNLRKAEIKDVLESLKTNEVFLNNFSDLEFNIYTYGFMNKVIGGRILLNNEELINFTNYKDVLNVKTEKENNKIDIVNNSKETKFDFKIDNNLLTIIKTTHDDRTNYEFSIETPNIELEGNLELEVKRVANKRVTSNILLDVKGKSEENFNINIKFNNITQVGGTIQNIPNGNIVVYDSLTEMEKRDISNKFNSLIEKLPFKDLFNKDDETPNYCDIATDCECFGSICTCSYLDKNGIEQSINCLNKN